MARLFPFRSEPAEHEGQPRIVDLEGEDADAVFSALSSTTARQIYARLDEEPGTPSDVAEAIDSSIQNVRYHLEKLEDAGLVSVVDTWYSSRGNEMSVYAATDGPLIVTGDESAASRIREALSRFVGGIGALAGGSLLVHHGLTRWAESATDSSGAGTAPAGTEPDDRDGADAGESADSTDDAGTDDSATDEDASDDFGAQQTDSEDEEMDEAASDDADVAYDDEDAGETIDADPTAGDGAVEPADGTAEVAQTLFETVPPGLIFFLGGLLVLTAVTLYWYWYRPAY
ncbi:ArsR/SmtB family transcription factor [Natronorubrum texcoconense]|uniref:Helix-turn-helix domain-containing protein n=1 Tax=Natronorubrum texcoconense TaxID=1095776 RepID=A0A1G8T063_9EURY|nr:helix-turn-helix domain-containing protein [Natronorubrum texcoconense]SDJ34813.1 Helix-turn-helix domain-containing protein [Natronorubrum texcoconense]